MKTLLVVALLAGCDSTGGRVNGPAYDFGGLVDFGARDFAGLDLAEPPQVDPTIIYAHEASTLYTVDPVTFDVTTVGSFGVSDSMTDLAVTPDGSIYTISTTSLYSVDSSTAKATLLMSNITSSNVALTFQTDGTLLASDKSGTVRVIDPVAKTVHDIGTYGSGFNTAGDLVAVSNGTLFGISETGPGSSSTSNVLLLVDPTSGKATGVGGIGYDQVFGLAYAGGRVLAFTGTGDIIAIDHTTGQGTLVRSYPSKSWYGAGTSPLVPIS